MESSSSKLKLFCKNCRLIKCPFCQYLYNDYRYGLAKRCSLCSFRSLCNKCENPNWSSGNQIVDDFIKECNQPNDILKWIPYNQLSEITYLAKGALELFIKLNGRIILLLF